jgi:hypothetical protein
MSERDRMRNGDDETQHSDLESPLGIAHASIPDSAQDHLRPGDPASRRRRTRALGEDGIDRVSDGLGDMNVDPDGAAGIDMGYGGEGTDVKP